jgi:hypothetical protein
VTAIEEAKDLYTLSVEDLISSLKCHEIGLNEQEPIRKPKTIALKSKGKSSQGLKANESEDESPVKVRKTQEGGLNCVLEKFFVSPKN